MKSIETTSVEAAIARDCPCVTPARSVWVPITTSAKIAARQAVSSDQETVRLMIRSIS